MTATATTLRINQCERSALRIRRVARRTNQPERGLPLTCALSLSTCAEQVNETERERGATLDSVNQRSWTLLALTLASAALLLPLLLLFLVSSSIFTLVASYQMAAAQLTFLTFVYTFVVVVVRVVVAVAALG